MSPMVKKILLVGGAAVAGYVVYTRFIKKPAKPTTVALPAAAAAKIAALSAGSRLSMMKVAAPIKTAGWY